jgi:hypothetical protein
VTWVLTVRGPMNSTLPISSLERPCASSRSTSCSREVSSGPSEPGHDTLRTSSPAARVLSTSYGYCSPTIRRGSSKPTDRSAAEVLAVVVCGVGLWWAQLALVALQARIRFSRLLRRPSDPRTATVTASKDGGRTVILDIIPRDGTRRRYQSLSEVRLALWLKAGMLVPGETVTVYEGSAGASKLLVSSPRWGRAFFGTVTSGPTVQRGPVGPLDDKVSGATLVDWAAWAASTTFSSTGRRFGYDIREVDAFRSAVRDTFLGAPSSG